MKEKSKAPGAHGICRHNGLTSGQGRVHKVIYLFFFSHLSPVALRRGSEESYTVIDYALRDQISVGTCQLEDLNLSPVRSTASMLTSRQGSANHLFRLKFRSNHSGDKVPMILGVEQL